MSLFIQWPLLAAMPGLLFLGLYRLLRRRWTMYASIAWLLYALYEVGMHWRLLCTGECNIRVDLLLIYPALAMVSLIGVVAATRRPWKVRG
jgi:hypothetical protein